MVGDSRTPECLDFADDLGRRRAVDARPVSRAAAIVDDDGGSLSCEFQGVSPSQSASCSGDDRHSPIENTHPFVALQGRSLRSTS